MYKMSWKIYLIYCLIMMIVFFILINAFKGQKVIIFDKETESMFQIIFHNFMLFIKWEILFILSPIYWLFETLVLSWMIKTGVITFGLSEAIDRLWRHGIIEIPNMFLYQLLSFRLLYFWWKDKSLTTIKKYLWVNKKFYLLSVVLILAAGIIEGIKW